MTGETDLHRQEISLLHVACQENLVLTATFIAQKYPLMMRQQSQACWTPLMSACEQGNLEVIKVLVGTGGPSLLEFASNGGTPLHAAISCNITASEPISSEKDEQDEKDENDELDFTQRAYHTVQLLVQLYKHEGGEAKRLTNMKDLNGVSPLMLACFIGDTSIVEFLLENGADPLLASSPANVTVLHVCAERGFYGIASMIL